MADSKGNKSKKKLTRFGQYLNKKGDVDAIVLERTGLTQLQLDNLKENEKSNLYGAILNDSIRAIVNDDDNEFDLACDFIYIDIKIPTYTKKTENDPELTDFGNYIQQFVVERRDIADKMAFKPAKLSKLILKKYNKTPLGSDIFILAKTHSLRPSQVFKDLYGNGNQTGNG
ncbi:hypothetical protein GCM10007415_40080 [Parapedobacter pyrenivorans]|uniref:Uncharacterized protein n=1 Tax=Parapedobacter pyrenivorans TaxID=1305674 RepID=A0A917I0T0_9SPHI|nr:hypothetical protein [Parapedobacter pyrenivorans]GGH00153.1 hypothetical protein GCM10007415_40080 [Parapedobacter pyrenivorans]